ncbi:hypothetical protein PHBOTO_004692 [Pseudozyma hubeiensis]|nr:hypothetical protein PHBOTO_004692 [Pseudozyma hubeiensis]
MGISRVACRSREVDRCPIRQIPDRTLPCLLRFTIFRLELISNVAKIERGQGQEERASSHALQGGTVRPFFPILEESSTRATKISRKNSLKISPSSSDSVWQQSKSLTSSLGSRAEAASDRPAAWCSHPSSSHHRVYRQFGLHLLKYRVTYLVSCFVFHHRSLFRSLTTPFAQALA